MLPVLSIGAVGGVLARFIDSYITNSQMSFLAGYWLTMAATWVILGLNRYHKTDTYYIDELKKYGIYDQVLKAEVARQEYDEYYRKIKEQYNIDMQVVERSYGF